MGAFTESCAAFQTYPKNLILQNVFRNNLTSYHERILLESARLFCHEEEGRTRIECLQFGSRKEFYQTSILSLNDLKKPLGFESLLKHDDVRCRLLFIHSPNSRETLNCTKSAMLALLTYYQVMPSFLDFLFTFGLQEHAHGFHFSGFRHESHLREIDRGPVIPELDRSGYCIQLCYSLRSVEPSKGQKDWPWSVRQAAVFHNLDIKTSHATWITIKGNRLLKERIASAGVDQNSDIASYDTVSNALASSLSTHLMYCDWAAENWGWYIVFLEEELQKSTRGTLSARVGIPQFPTPTRPFASSSSLPRSPTKIPSWKKRMSFNSEKSDTLPDERGVNFSSLPTVQEGPYRPIPPPNKPFRRTEPTDFTFSDMQRIHFLEEKANEVSMVLKLNLNVVQELKRHYNALLQNDNGEWSPGDNYKLQLGRFERHIDSIESEMKTQQSRVKTLLSLLRDRKSLLYGILEYRNMESTKILTEKTQISTDNMQEIARKTQRETVSMRIITLVTLFFLPGTFISTIMSTDIVRYSSSDTEQRVVSLEALSLYLSITLPLMFATFTSWYGVYWWERRKERVANTENETISLT